MKRLLIMLLLMMGTAASAQMVIRGRGFAPAAAATPTDYGCKTILDGNHVWIAPVGSRYVLEYVDSVGVVRRRK